MKFQTKPWKCGPAAVRNLLRTYGIKVSEDVLTSECGTTQDGTDDWQVIKAIRAHNLVPTEYSSNSKKHGWKWLHGSLIQGEAVVLCVEAWQHWIVCVGSLGDRVIVIDSSNFKYNMSENGVHVWDRKRLMWKWWNARVSLVEEEKRLYAISVRRKSK